MFADDRFHEKGVKTNDVQKLITTQVSILKLILLGSWRIKMSICSKRNPILDISYNLITECSTSNWK